MGTSASGDGSMKPVRVWDLQTRIFHWSLLVVMVCSYITADFLTFVGIDLVARDIWLSFHVGTGAAVGILLAFRLFWGWYGPRYSRFSSLRLSLRELVSYLDAVRKNVETSYTGHNPAASWSLLLIIAGGLLTVLSGVVLFGLEEGRGFLGPYLTGFQAHAGVLRLSHSVAATALALVIAAHIGGVLNESIRHRSGIITAMITGWKRSTDPDVPIIPGRFQNIVALAWVLSPFAAVLYFSDSLEASRPPGRSIPPAYRKECGSCHLAFSPNLLPAASWRVMMGDLQNHFGEDATLDRETALDIERYLVGNAAETSGEEASVKILRSLRQGDAPLRITDVPYWRNKHRSVNPAVYDRSTVKSKINCVACHKWAEYGSFEDSDIRIPE